MADRVAGGRLPEHEAAQAEACAEIERALVRLTPRQRAILKLQFGEGLGRAQIAERLGRHRARDQARPDEELREVADRIEYGPAADAGP